MNKKRLSGGRAFRALFIIVLTIMLTTQFVTAQGWYDGDWLYRSPVSVPNPGSAELTEFQVKVTLTNGVNFDFSKILAAGGSDIRITDADGTTLIPFWIETWSAGVSATIWVKVPVIPVTGTTVYVYSGNANPTLPSTDPYEVPPTGPFTRAAGNPIVPAGAGGNVSLLAENIVWDPVTQHYWMVFANYSVGGVGLAWSDNPRDPASWTWHGNVYTHGGGGSFAPHILFEDGLWYIFFARLPNIVYITCSTINGTYSAPSVVLSPTETWETYRVDEPYVFKRNDGTWIMVYMADSGNTTEQVGYASSTSLTGPYTKFSGNPCIPFGPRGSYDAGTVADPWVYEFHDVYYIGYTVSPTKSSPWSTAIATTTDWLTFTKRGMILPATGTTSDAQNSFRGAVTRIGDEYVFSYTNDGYRMAIATQPVYMTPPNIVNNPDAVFNFYDGFNTADGSDPDPAKWTFTSGTATQTNIAGGLLTMTASGTYVKIDGLTYVGTGYVGETYARHPDRGTLNMIMETGFMQGAFTNTLRIVDDFPSITNWQRQNKTSATVGDPFVNMAQTSDIDWHTFRVYREVSGSAGFRIDDNTIETVSTDVPTLGMAPFLMSYGSGNRFVIDWTRVRKWAGADPVTTVGTGQSLAVWTGTGGNGWETPGSWSTNTVPLATDDVAILDAANDPFISTAVTVNSMIIEPAASLTVLITGSLTATRSITINTSGTGSSGSLIGHGPVTGSVIFNRFLRPQNNRGERHFISSPVGGQSISGFRMNNFNLGQIWQYDEVTGTWPLVGSGSFESARGYNISQAPGSLGEYSFTGSLVDNATYTATSPYATGYTDRSTALSYNENASWVEGRSWTNYGGGGWNLMGNPFTSAMNAGDFISGNPGKFDPHYQALYVYDGILDRYLWVAASTPGYPLQGEFTGGNIQAGQGFFVLALYDGIVFNFNSGMQRHQPGVTLLKSGTVEEDPWPGLQLKVRFGEREGLTTIVYNSEMTTGNDPGFDVGQLTTSPDVEIYTTLVAKDNSVNFARQALPVTGAETFVVPVGIDSEKGGEVTFSAFIVPLGNSRFWLEDKATGIFTDLTTKSYTVTLPAKTYGTGRFNIIASANTPSGIREQQNVDTDLRIWTSNEKVIIKGEISDRAICEIFDLRGQKILQSHLTDEEVNTVELPSGLHGVFMVRVTDGARVTTRKVALL